MIFWTSRTDNIDILLIIKKKKKFRNIIDVAALDTHHILEQTEYNDRLKAYNQRLAQQWNTIPTTETNYNGLLKDVANPEQLLAANPQLDDVNTVSNFFNWFAIF